MPESPLISYSQNGEDVRLWRVFRDLRDGFYVDVGAGHPTDISVTRLFYERGWTGINIEPGPNFEELSRERPRDINLRIAVGSDDGRATFWVTAPFPDLSSLDPSIAQDNPEQIESVHGIEIEQRRLATLLAEHAGGRRIDFLKIDVEGAESAVLESNDWRRFRPVVVIVESIRPGTHTLVHDQWEYILVENGYRFSVFDGVNRWYVCEEQAESLVDELAYPLTPALDEFIGAAEADALRRITKMFTDLQAVVAERDALFADREAARAELAAVFADRELLITGRAALSTEHSDLLLLKEELEAALDSALAELTQMRQTLSWRMTAPLRRLRRRS